MENSWSLSEKKALITGGTKGIGLAIADEFLRLGAEIFVVARDKKILDRRLQNWNDQDLPADGASFDISNNDQREKLFKILESKWNSLDILINNVGTNIRKKVMEYSMEEYQFILSTNMTSTFAMCRRAYPLLKQSGNASIVNLTSVAGLTHIRHDQVRHRANDQEYGSGMGKGWNSGQHCSSLVYPYTTGKEAVTKQEILSGYSFPNSHE